MEIENTYIKDLRLIHFKKFKDNRGLFIKTYNADFFLENGLETEFKESYYSVSQKNVIRGMHFQVPPAAHTKLVFVNRGAIIDVILDIRKESATYGMSFKIHLQAYDSPLIYIPIGCAHGFLSLEDDTVVSYLQTSCYDSLHDTGIKYDSFNMDWPSQNPIVSEKDLLLPMFNAYNSPF